MAERDVIAWLLDGDPAIRWQTLHDLLDADPADVALERTRVATQGWGARLLAEQDAAGTWAGQLYNGKWVSTTYTLALLRRMGLPQDNPQAQRACGLLLAGGWRDGVITFARARDVVDRGVTGIVLALLAYFRHPDARVHAVAAYLCEHQQPEGCWLVSDDLTEQRYTLDCTYLVLEGLDEYARHAPGERVDVSAAAARGREYLVRCGLYRRDQGDAPIHPSLLHFSFPPRWHCDALAALDHLQASGATYDSRLAGAIALVRARRRANGTWPLHNRHTGRTFFEMEAVGQPSRWNTLRALRVLHWCEKPAPRPEVGI